METDEAEFFLVARGGVVVVIEGLVDAALVTTVEPGAVERVTAGVVVLAVLEVLTAGATTSLRPKVKPAGTASPASVPPVTIGVPKVRVTPLIGESCVARPKLTARWKPVKVKPTAGSRATPFTQNVMAPAGTTVNGTEML